LKEIQIERRFKNPSNLLSQLNQVSIRFDLYNKVKKTQQVRLRMIQENVQGGIVKDFTIKNDVLKFRHWLCISRVAELKNEIMNKAYCTPYIAHLGSTRCIRTYDIVFSGMG